MSEAMPESEERHRNQSEESVRRDKWWTTLYVLYLFAVIQILEQLLVTIATKIVDYDKKLRSTSIYREKCGDYRRYRRTAWRETKSEDEEEVDSSIVSIEIPFKSAVRREDEHIYTLDLTLCLQTKVSDRRCKTKDSPMRSQPESSGPTPEDEVSQRTGQKVIANHSPNEDIEGTTDEGLRVSEDMTTIPTLNRPIWRDGVVSDRGSRGSRATADDGLLCTGVGEWSEGMSGGSNPKYPMSDDVVGGEPHIDSEEDLSESSNTCALASVETESLSECGQESDSESTSGPFLADHRSDDGLEVSEDYSIPDGGKYEGSGLRESKQVCESVRLTEEAISDRMIAIANSIRSDYGNLITYLKPVKVKGLITADIWQDLDDLAILYYVQFNDQSNEFMTLSVKRVKEVTEEFYTLLRGIYHSLRLEVERTEATRTFLQTAVWSQYWRDKEIEIQRKAEILIEISEISKICRSLRLEMERREREANRFSPMRSVRYRRHR